MISSIEQPTLPLHLLRTTTARLITNLVTTSTVITTIIITTKDRVINRSSQAITRQAHPRKSQMAATLLRLKGCSSFLEVCGAISSAMMYDQSVSNRNHCNVVISLMMKKNIGFGDSFCKFRIGYFSSKLYEQCH